MDCKTVAATDVQVAGQTVLTRVDFNVPMEKGRITDNTRIVTALRTINYLRDNGAKTILCSHLGRPKGEPKPALSLAPVKAALEAELGSPVGFVDDCIGAPVAKAVAQMVAGDVILLENTRFYCAEASKNEAEMLAFAEKLAAPAQMFVNDAFGSCHRRHASVYGVTRYLSPCVAGFLVEKEILALEKLLAVAQAGFIAVLGGAKVKDKIGTIKSLLPRVQSLLIGGAMSWAFFKARGREIGESLCDDESLKGAQQIYAEMGEYLDKIVLPEDVHIQNVQDPSQMKYVGADEIEPGWSALDIGPQTAAKYAEIVLQAQNVFWNGPMGKFEDQPFDEGTLAVAKAMGDCPGYNVIGGGDSVAAITQMDLADRIDHVSTGGGASLEFIEFEGHLPGLDALSTIR